MTWIERKTITCNLEDIPFDPEGTIKLIDPSTLRINIPGFTYPVDIGSWCYTRRRKPYYDTLSEKCSIVQVDNKSFRKARIKFITKYLDYLCTHISLGKSPRTLLTNVGQFAQFINWCDENMIQALDGKSLTIEAIKCFTENLIHRAKSNDININTAASSQLVSLTAIKWIYNDEYNDISQGVRIIHRSYAATNITEPPNNHDAIQAIQLYKELFIQLTKFVINFDKFPLHLKLSHGKYWFFPNQTPIVSKKRLSDPRYLNHTNYAYNYESGNLNTLEYISSKSRNNTSDSKVIAEKILANAHKTIESSNVDQYHHRRILGATLAMQSFIMLFTVNTGMNLGLTSNLLWGNNNYTIDRDQQGFKTIKYRAGNKIVSFIIASSFVVAFNKYLKLRLYILNSFKINKYKYLFFSVTNGKITPLSMNFSTNYNERLKRLFDINKTINTRQWRAFKGDWLIRNTDLSTTSMIMQNSPRTILKHYSEGSEKNAASEITSYFKEFSKNIIITNNTTSKQISTGQCLSENTPAHDGTKTIFTPDCNKPEGCLFCTHYAVHADTTDLRKLYSFKYILQQTRIMSANNEHYNNLFITVINRINEIIKSIKSINLETNKMADIIKSEVFISERLDLYWLKKLEILIDLELI